LNLDLNIIWISPLIALGSTGFFSEMEIDIAFLIGNKAALLEIFLKIRQPYSAVEMTAGAVCHPAKRQD
jgi:hypothetical protein